MDLKKREVSKYLGKEIQEKAVVFSKKIKNTKKELSELCSELEKLYSERKAIVDEFDKFFIERQQKIKELVRKIREENSKRLIS